MKNVKLTSRKAGFSLVEMLIVLGIIGLIAAIAIPNLGKKTAEVKALPEMQQTIAGNDGSPPPLGNIEKNPDATTHPNNNLDYKMLSIEVITAYNYGADHSVFNPAEHQTIDAKLDAILKNSARCNASKSLTTAIASKSITSGNMKHHVSIATDGKLQPANNGTATVTSDKLPSA